MSWNDNGHCDKWTSWDDKSRVKGRKGEPGFTFTSRFKDLLGMQFGRLFILRLNMDESIRRGIAMWDCLCDCLNIKTMRGPIIASDVGPRSCGVCTRKERKNDNLKKPGHTPKDKLYRTWNNIKARCSPKNKEKKKWYFDRGITVCQEWLDDFMVFRSWAMENGYQEDLEIDRIDNDGNYEPSNCRWVTHRENMSNVSKTVMAIYKGEEKPLMEIVEKYSNNDYKMVYQRMRRGWNLDDALSVPNNGKRKKS